MRQGHRISEMLHKQGYMREKTCRYISSIRLAEPAVRAFELDKYI